MRYLGGKSRIAKEIAAVVAPRGEWWEPFCGGLSVSVQLAKYGPGLVSDACLPLISLYQAVRDGWDPPTTLSKDQWSEAKQLPDTDPLKAFAGFGCSFRSMWFQAHDAGGRQWNNDSVTGGRWINLNPAKGCRTALLRDLRALASCDIRCLSFLDINPHNAPAPECIYADPPYAGTTGYDAIEEFDHARFWSYCQAWANRGVRVFVSEYACPVAAELVWEKSHRSRVGRRSGELGKITQERLFRILPTNTESS